MREVEHAERAVDDGQAGADQREQGAEREPVEKLRNEVGPTNHAMIAILTRDGLRQKKVTPQVQSAAYGVTGVSAGSGVVAEMAAERVRLLHQAFTRDDLDDV